MFSHPYGVAQYTIGRFVMEYYKTATYAKDRAAAVHSMVTGHQVYLYPEGAVECAECGWRATIVWDCVRRRLVAKYDE